ncbi:hypothetical protein [Absidia glauca]|uniref:Uncharacterized protein n=1 Tax=Absidia glauca TaxID=4829 RepID=A0A168RMJ5_ABSGL|nr:hypothetical protein [Absidia glauca]
MRTFYTAVFILWMFVTVMNAQQPTSSGMAMTSTSQTTSMGTPLPTTTTNEASNATSTVTHGSLAPPSAPSPSSPPPTTTRPPQFAPLPDDTVGKNGRLRVSSMALARPSPDPSLFAPALLLLLSLLIAS